MRSLLVLSLALQALATVPDAAFDDNIIHPQQQKEAFNTTEIPRAPLPWGKVNFLHTTDTHGWLDGHANVPSWGADWGDFVSFVTHMKDKALRKKVDLLLIDSGDFHDGGGLSDSTSPKGAVSDSIFETIDYDILTIGNHGVRTGAEALNVHHNLSRVFGDRFLTSNVDVKDNGILKPIGNRYRAFQTRNGLRIVAFGVTINDPVLRDLANTEVYSAEWIFKQTWFEEAMGKEADLYVLVGHAPTYAPCRDPKKDNPLVCLRDRIRSKTDRPIQLFGGHAHHRDFTCYDERSAGIESGKYCDTVGWVALNEVSSPAWSGAKTLLGGDEARPNKSCATGKGNQGATYRDTPYLLDRRYLDWNRVTFAYHTGNLEGATGNNPSVPVSFDTPLGRKVTDDITKARHLLNLTHFLGCAKQDYCFNCKKVGQDGNIYELLKDALADTVVRKERASVPRVVISNDGTIRDNIYQGPFMTGDAYAIVPFPNHFQYIATMSCPEFKKMTSRLRTMQEVSCIEDTDHDDNDSSSMIDDESPRSKPQSHHLDLRGIIDDRSDHHEATSPQLQNGQRKQHSPGYTTHDALGNDGDDTLHSPLIEDERYMKLFWSNASFPNPSQYPASFDVVFTNYLAKRIVAALNETGAPYTEKDVVDYLPRTYTSRDVLVDYTARHWGQDMENCPIKRPGDREPSN
ncbi:Metallo-dependent phosphatase-like protein [Aspergillus pseudoustus]|uniref:Metallo-dependent phosphatase-like protein n=1 Tax=Aspergillus pseudoustus TaxID=1810923 RepID=A0ABR4K135_9EURO